MLTLRELERIPYSVLLQYIPPSQAYPALKMFFQAPPGHEPIEVESDPAEGKIHFSILLDARSWDPILITSSCKSDDDPIRIGCDCGQSAQGPCVHQCLLILALWAVFHPTEVPGAPTRAWHTQFDHYSRVLRGRIERAQAEVSTSLASLESILLCVDTLEGWDPRQSGSLQDALWSTGPTETLPAAPPVPSDALGSSPTPRGARSYEIPHSLLAYPLRPYQENKSSTEGAAFRLSRLVQYRFTDGTVLDSSEIFYHALGRRVPIALLPLRSQMRPGKQEHSDLRVLDVPIADWMNDDAESLLASVLIEASERPLPVYLTRGQNREEERQALKILKVSAHPKKYGASWHAYLPGQAEPSFQSPPTPDELARGWTLFRFEPRIPGKDDLLVFKGFTFDRGGRQLRFHQFLETIRRFHALLRADPSAPSTPELVFRGHETRRSVVEYLNPALQSVGLPRVELHFPRPRELALSERQPEIHFRTRELDFGFSVRFEDGGRRWRAWNLPRQIQGLTQVLREGIGALHPGKNTELARSSPGIKRERDLRALKHLGLAALLVGELTSYFLDGKTAEGQPLRSDRELWDHLDRRLGSLLYRAEAPESPLNSAGEAPLFSELCSRLIIPLVREWCEETLQSARKDPGCDLLFADHVVHWSDAARASWRVIHQLVRGIAIESGGRCFEKPRLGAFDAIGAELELGDRLAIQGALLLPAETAIHHSEALVNPTDSAGGRPLSYRVDPAWLPNPRAWLRTLLPLREAGMAIFLDGRPLEALADSDLRARVEFAPQERQERPVEPATLEAELPATLPATLEAELPRTGRLDWFELHPRLFFRGVEIDPANLSRWKEQGVLEHQGQLYYISEKNLPSIQRLENFWARLRGDGSARDGAPRNEGGYLRLPRSEILELLALRASGADFTANPEFDEICRFYDQLGKPRKPVALPKTLRIELTAFQRIGVQWLYDLYRLRLGAILADEMGLGKTPQTLCFLELLRSERSLGNTLIVVPTSLTYNWKSEAERFAPRLPIHSFQSRNRKGLEEFLRQNPDGGVVICTYGLLAEHIEVLEKTPWTIVVFDEAQSLKNLAAQRTSAARRLPARFKACLTGTPLENHLGEFFSILDLVVPGCLGDYTDFRQRFVNPEVVQPEDIRYLRLKARPLVLRRTKAEILTELPPKMESTVKLPFEKRQEKIYRDIALSCNDKIKSLIDQKGESRAQLEMLAALLRLRQACSDPAGLPGIGYRSEPPKFSVLKDALAEITESGDSALVFTQFLASYGRIEKTLRSEGIPVFGIHGGTPARERERILREFQESPRGAVLLLTLKTGGVGLNLTKANYVFHLEPWWNPAVENQATDRAHRIGQRQAVQVFRYLMSDSVEEKIEILKHRKQATFDALFAQTAESEDSEAVAWTPGLTREKGREPGSGLLTRADFEYLIG